MEFLHCNGCGHHPHYCDTRNYFLTSCGHVFCQTCSSRIEDTCPTCGAKCKLVQVSKESKSEIKAFFGDPMELFKDNMRQLVQVMQFQKTQMKSFNSHFGKLLQCQNAIKADNDSLKNENIRLMERLEALNRDKNLVGNGRKRDGRNSPPNTENTGFMQQPIGPTFNSIFGQQPTTNLEFGSTICSPPTPDSMATPPAARKPSDGRNYGRVSLPMTPTLHRREVLMPRYSANISSIGSSGDSQSFTSRVGHALNHQQKQMSRTPTPDIVARLKKLRW